MLLSDIARELGLSAHGPDVDVAGVASDSRRVRAGDLFAAIPGARHDGLRFVPDAVKAGAVAVCATTPVDGLPTLVAPEPRAVLGTIAASVYGHPSRSVRVIGLTGTLGKTSTALTLAHCLSSAGTPAGVIGSLGIEIPGMADWSTELTTPEAPVIQFALRVMHQRDIRHAIMEVSSHSLLLQRVEGVQLALGIFLNLVPDEHLEFHPTPEHYLQTKLRFLELLRPDAPLVHNGDDPLTRDAMVRDAKRRPGADRIGISSHDSPDAAVWVKVEPHGVSGSRLLLQLRRELPRLDGGRVQAGTLELHFPRLGSQLAWNATIAATAALVVGASPDAIAEALPSLPPISRRMQVVHESGPLVVDDTAGNPRSIRAVLETVRSLDRRRAHIVYVVRGARGPAINRENGAAIADLATGLDAELMVSASEEQANVRNRVTAEERDAVLEALNAAGVTYRYEPRLDSAMDRTMADVARDDLVLLLGAQGMDAGADLARLALARNAGGSNSTAPASGQRAAEASGSASA